MTQTRYNDLKVALYERIKEKGPCDDLTLLTWLVSCLDEWVEHLETGAFSCERIMQTDFFGMFMIGIEVIDEVKTTSEFKQVFPERDWMEFKNAVTWLEKMRDREDISLVERTYQKFKNSFAAISEENSNHDRELGTRFVSKIEWWPRSNLLSPVELRTSRVILSFAILFLLGSIFCFLGSLRFLLYSSVRPGAWLLTKHIPVCFLFLSVLFFAVWTVLGLSFRCGEGRKNEQKSFCCREAAINFPRLANITGVR